MSSEHEDQPMTEPGEKVAESTTLQQPATEEEATTATTAQQEQLVALLPDGQMAVIEEGATTAEGQQIYQSTEENVSYATTSAAPVLKIQDGSYVAVTTQYVDEAGNYVTAIPAQTAAAGDNVYVDGNAYYVVQDGASAEGQQFAYTVVEEPAAKEQPAEPMQVDEKPATQEPETSKEPATEEATMEEDQVKEATPSTGGDGRGKND